MKQPVSVSGEVTRSFKKEHALGLSVLLLFSVLIVYLKIFQYPFIQDDWYILHSLKAMGTGEFIARAFIGVEGVFYRPVAALYMAFIYSIFGMEPTGFHFFALMLHGINALIVAAITFKLIQRIEIAWGAGFLYALSASLHLDSLLWFVGSNDILGALFFFSTLLFFLQKRIWLSTLCYVLAIFTKEATLLLPGILLFLSISMKDNARVNVQGLRHAFLEVKYFIGVAIGYGAIRFNSIVSFSEQTGNPYHSSLWGTHIVENISKYVQWSFEGVFPIIVFDSGIWITLVQLVLFFGLAFSLSGFSLKRNLFFISWIVLGIFPVMFLQDHAFRYYLTYSYPAIAIFGLTIIDEGVEKLKITSKPIIAQIVLLCFLTAGFSWYYFSDLDRQGFDTLTVEGSNNLIRKGSIVRMLDTFLQKEYPAVPESSVFIFDWLPTEAFGGEKGLSLRYNMQALSVYEIQAIQADAKGVYPKSNASVMRNYIDPKKIIYISFHGDRLRRGK
ncbi:MAG: hypothetical protein EPO24_08070 [Bacteroidetes bacterium]|nr:MAG: hypothetical protein EPO24_08070 [Bacteroidota bacterium]